MRFDLFGISRSRIANPPGLISQTNVNWYINLFFLQIKPRVIDPLNPYKRSNFSLLFISKQYDNNQQKDAFWHIEVLFIVFRSDKLKVARAIFANHMEKQLRSKPKRFSDRVKASARF